MLGGVYAPTTHVCASYNRLSAPAAAQQGCVVPEMLVLGPVHEPDVEYVVFVNVVAVRHVTSYEVVGPVCVQPTASRTRADGRRRHCVSCSRRAPTGQCAESLNDHARDPHAPSTHALDMNATLFALTVHAALRKSPANAGRGCGRRAGPGF